MAEFNIDVLIDDRIVTTETEANKVVDAHPWVAEARAWPSKIASVVPPLTDLENMMVQTSPDYQKVLTQRTKAAQLDAIDKTLSKMPKPEDLATSHPPVVEPEASYADQLALSNLLGLLQLGLYRVVADKIEATLETVARDPYPSPKLPLLREMLPLTQTLEVKKPDGAPDYDAMARLRLVAMRGDDLLRSSRDVLLERAAAALEVERYRLTAMRAAVEEFGDWSHPQNVSARVAPVMPGASQRRREAEERRKAREQKAQAAGFKVSE